MKTYHVNEWFLSLQGEGVRAGTLNLFVRFQNCNQRCAKETHGFDCDTEFMSGRGWSLDDLVAKLKEAAKGCTNIILTGGEPCLQVDGDLIDRLHHEGFYLAIETNGSMEIPAGATTINWVCVSPKVAEHAVKPKFANEVKYVRSDGQGIPQPTCRADHYILSPAFDGTVLPPANLAWCMKLIHENPEWRLSAQLHKLWGVR